MKRIIYAFLPLAVCLLSGCTDEPAGLDDGIPAGAWQTVSVNLGRETADETGTRSLINLPDDTVLREVTLYAIDPATGLLMYYDPERYDGIPAGFSQLNQPVMLTRRENDGSSLHSFSWVLPLDREMDIYAIANYGSLPLPDGGTKESPMSRSELEKLVYTCADVDAFLDLEQSGMPMATIARGQKITRLQSGIAIVLKNLYARFIVKFDLSLLEAEQLECEGLALRICNAPRSVHWFGSGEKVTERTQFLDSEDTDRATAGQLSTLVTRPGEAVSLYVLENMQGAPDTPARSWKTVEKDLKDWEALPFCTYLEMAVNVRQAGQSHQTWYPIYLGKTDMRSDFDVQRNYSKTIRLKVPAAEGRIRFTDPSPTVWPGGTVTLHYVVEGISNEVVEACLKEVQSAQGSIQIISFNKKAQTITIEANKETKPGDFCTLFAGNDAYHAQALQTIQVVASPIVHKLELSTPDGNMARSTKETVSIRARFNTYQDGELVKSTDVTSTASWPTSVTSSNPVGYSARVSAGVLSCSYPDYTTPELRFNVSCSYTYEGDTYTSSISVGFRETHYLFFYMDTMPRDTPATNATYAYPRVSERVPCPVIVQAANVQAHGNYEWIFPTGAQAITERSELPLFDYASTAAETRVTYVTTNTYPNAQNWYDEDNRVSYFFVIDNNYAGHEH